MKVLKDNFTKRLNYSTYIALGSFDGLHLGHKALINKTIELSRKNKAKSMVFTFFNHPLSIINEDMMPKLIMSNSIKIESLKKMGIDILNLSPFDDEFMHISPEDFVKKLIDYYGAVGLVVGFNYRFGYKNLGDIDLLKKLSAELGYELHIMDAVKIGEDLVSSATIRNLICEGNMVKANKMLDHLYKLEGRVIKGRQLGREIGFPTINLDYDKKFIIPKGGVYYSAVQVREKFFKGITNIGYNPTVKGGKLSVETHIIDFNQDIYDKNVSIYFIERIRDEKKFNSLEELSNQLSKDKLFVRSKNLSIKLKS
jgi:riboflavin kinase/FMN adenylyltransferase